MSAIFTKTLTVFCLIILSITICSGCATTCEKSSCDPRRSYCPRSEVTPPDEPAAFSDQISRDFGIEVVSLRLSAAGHLLDFRYRVLDPAKAAPIFDRHNTALLVDQATGTRLSVPRMAKVGPLRQTNFQPDPGRVYFILFANSGGVVATGSRVSLQIGDHTIDHLVVQ